MDEWTRNQKKKWRPICDSAIDHLNKNVPDKIVAMREATDAHTVNRGKISQRALAEILGILPQNFHKIEKGKIYGGNNVTLEQAIKLSLFFNCTIDYIVKSNQAAAPSNSRMMSALEDQLATEKRMNEMLTQKIKDLEAENAKLRARKRK